MADTVYTDGVTLLTADTMNDLNRLHYTILGDPADDAAVISGLGITATIAELNHAAGVTSAIQTQLNAKIGKDLSGETGKTTPVDADLLALSDSAASFGLKKLTWANLKATAKTYFDGLYASLAGSASQTFSVASASAAEHAVTALQYQNNALRYQATTGTSTAYVVTIPILTAYTDGLTLDIQPHVSCGSSPTLNINGVISLNIKKVTTDGSLIDLAANDLIQYINATITYSAAVGYFVLRDARAIPTAGTTGQVLTSQGAGAIPVWATQSFTTHTTSGNLTWATSSTTTWAHGLGGTPKFLRYTLKCLAAENGYSIGDTVGIGNLWNNAAGTPCGFSTIYDETNIVLAFCTTAPSIPPKTGGAVVTMTAGNWAVVLDAWR